MRRILFQHVHLPTALLVLVVFTIAASSMVAAQAHAALLNFGGRVSLVSTCVLDTPAIAPTTCAVSCPLCTVTWGTACANHVEVRFQPSGGNGNFTCPTKTQYYRGGGKFPRPAGWSLWNGFSIGGLLLQAGIGQ